MLEKKDKTFAQLTRLEKLIIDARSTPVSDMVKYKIKIFELMKISNCPALRTIEPMFSSQARALLKNVYDLLGLCDCEAGCTEQSTHVSKSRWYLLIDEDDLFNDEYEVFDVQKTR